MRLKTKNNIFNQLFTLAVFFTLFCSTNLSAQSWIREYPFPQFSYPFSEDYGSISPSQILELDDGSFVSVGSVRETSSDHQILIVHINAQGDLLWSKTYGGAAVDHANAVAQTPEGHFLITGYSEEENPENSNLVVLKVDEQGELLWSYKFGSHTELEVGQDILIASPDEYLIFGTSNQETSLESGYILKLNANGELLSEETDPVSFYSFFHDAHFASNGDVLIAGLAASPFHTDFLIQRRDASLQEVLWTVEYTEIGGDTGDDNFGVSVLETSDQQILLAGLRRTDNLNSNELAILKVDANGNVLWFQSFPLGDGQVRMGGIGLFENADGTFSTSAEIEGIPSQMALIRFDIDGNLVANETIPGVVPFGLAPTSDGSIIAYGYIDDAEKNLFFLRTNTQGVFYASAIQGQVQFDVNEDCDGTSDETGLKNWIVSATDGVYTWYANTDSTGHYIIPVNAGDYTVEVQPSSYLWQACPNTNPQSISIGSNDSLSVDFLFQALTDCPLLTVDLSTPALRRCFDNTYYLEYCNIGTALATDAYVDVVLDELLSINSASLPYTLLGDSLLRFQLGDVAIQACRQIILDTYLDCDNTTLGQTHCSSAHIYPDSLCINPDSSWDFSSLTVEAICQGDSVVFQITNIGTGNMGTPQAYYIVVDEVIMHQGNIQLESGAFINIAIPAESQTYFFSTQQSPGHPGTSAPSIAIEGCPDFGALGFYTWYATDDEDYFIDIDCQQNIGSYDPNDKQAFPQGYGEAHYIENVGLGLEYLIRFQNTGTDTAFTVVVEDELSSSLDLSTLRFGVASHPYTWRLSGAGTLEIRFDDIMLPDSNVNLAASNGFVKFSINAKRDLPIGTQIDNAANIYFDFNEPIVTNNVFHTIGENFIPYNLVSVLSLPDTDFPVKVFPNPFREETTFEISDHSFQDLELRITDMNGRLVGKVQTNGSTVRWRSPHTLASGIYFYRLLGDGKQINQGKVVITR